MFTNREYQPFFRTSLGTLLQGDCLEIMPAMRPGIFDLILCDLPYGITDLEWDKRISMEPLWREYWRLLKPNGTVVLTAQQPFATDLIQAARKFFRYELIWEKSCALGFLNAKKMPLRAHENLLVFYRALPVYNPQMVHRSTLPAPLRCKKGRNLPADFGGRNAERGVPLSEERPSIREWEKDRPSDRKAAAAFRVVGQDLYEPSRACPGQLCGIRNDSSSLREERAEMGRDRTK